MGLEGQDFIILHLLHPDSPTGGWGECPLAAQKGSLKNVILFTRYGLRLQGPSCIQPLLPPGLAKYAQFGPGSFNSLSLSFYMLSSPFVKLLSNLSALLL